MLKPLHSAPKQRRRERRMMAMMGIVIVFLVLVLVGVGAAAYYAFYQSQSAPAVAEQPLPAPKPRDAPATTPQAPAKNAKIGVSLTAVTSPVKPGGNTSVVIKTLQTAACSINFTYNDEKKPVNDSGLVPKTADEFGVASWTWTVPGDARPGTWPAKVTCAYGQQSAVVEATIAVAP